MYVELRTTQVVKLNLKMSCGFREQSIYVASSVPTSTIVPSANFSKSQPSLFIIGPNEFHQNTNSTWTVQIDVNKNYYFWYDDIHKFH